MTIQELYKEVRAGNLPGADVAEIYAKILDEILVRLGVKLVITFEDGVATFELLGD